MTIRHPHEVYFATEKSGRRWLSVNADGKVVRFDYPEALSLSHLEQLLRLIQKDDVTVYRLCAKE